MTGVHPAAIAFGISPAYLIPPSAIIGMSLPLSAFFTSKIAESCGYPTPAITLVVHIEPGPIQLLLHQPLFL